MSEAAAQEKIEFIDLQAQRRRLGDDLQARIDAVLEHGRFILGPEVAELELRLAEFAGVEHAVGCANGTDALVLALRALGLQEGEGVLVPSFTFCATAEAVAICGGVPVFVDVQEDTFNVDPQAVREAIPWCRQRGIELAGLIAVDLFGLPADYPALEAALADEDLWIIADAAQGFGGRIGDRRVGSLARVSTTSFFPAKPLGCYGDGGALLSDDADIASVARSLRVHGKGEDKYDNVRVGYNSRLDTLQAAVVLAKLDVFEDELERRGEVASRYTDALEDVVAVPRVPEGFASAWAQYTIRLEDGRRDSVAESLRGAGVPTAVYYMRSLHEQTAYRDCPVPASALPVSEALPDRVLSLPMHAYLEAGIQDRIVGQVRAACGA